MRESALRLLMALVLAGLAPGFEFYAVAGDVFVGGNAVPGANVVPMVVVPAAGPGSILPQSGSISVADNLRMQGIGSALPVSGAISQQGSQIPVGSVQGVPGTPAASRPGRNVEGLSSVQEASFYALESAAQPIVPAAFLANVAISAMAPAAASEAMGKVLKGVSEFESIQKSPQPVTAEAQAALGTSAFEQAVYGRGISWAKGGVQIYSGIYEGSRSERGPPQETQWPKKPGQGKVDQSQGDFMPHEMRIAQYLAAEGHRVQALPEDPQERRRHADAMVDGVKVEFKTRMPDGRTGERSYTGYKWIVHVVEKSLQRGGQARVLFLDARGSGLQPDQVGIAATQLSQYFGRKLDSLRVIGDGFDKAFGVWTGNGQPDFRYRLLMDGEGADSGAKQYGRESSGLSPPVPGSKLSLQDYRYPFQNRYSALKLLHYSAYVASFALLTVGLGIPGLVGSVLGAVLTYFDPGRPAEGPSAFNSNLYGQERKKVESDAREVFKALLRRLDVALAPDFSVSNARGEMNASASGMGIGSDSRIMVGEGTARMPANVLAAVLGHELGHLHNLDSRRIGPLRDTGWAGKILVRFFATAYSVAAVAIAFASLFIDPTLCLQWIIPGAAFASIPAAVTGLWAGYATNREEEYRADHFAAWLTDPVSLADFFRHGSKAQEPFKPKSLSERLRYLYWKHISRDHPAKESRIERLVKMAAGAIAIDRKIVGTSAIDEPRAQGEEKQHGRESSGLSPPQALERLAAVRERIAEQVAKMGVELGRSNDKVLDTVIEDSNKFLDRIAENIRKGESDPSVEIRTSADDSEKPVQGRVARIGIYPVTADPFTWGHLLAALQAMAVHKLDKVVFVIAADDPRKPNVIPVALRHPMGREVLKLFEPFFAYSSIAVGTDFDGERNMFRVLQLNPKQALEAHYMVGDDHYRLKDKKGNPDTLPKIERNMADPELGFDPAVHEVKVLFTEREGHSEVVPTGLDVEFLPLIRIESSSTEARKGQVRLIPYVSYEYILKHKLYSIDREKSKE